MAQIPFRVNLQGMTFPMLSELSGRTVIVGDRDHTYVPELSVPRDGQVPVDRGIPQVYYAHNVMPSTYGFQSVGFDVEYSGIDWIGETPGPLNFQDIHLIQAGNVVASGEATVVESLNYKTYLAAAGIGTNSVFVLDPITKKWKLARGAPAVTEDTRVTIATVNGVSYIYFSKIGAYVYNSTTNTLVRRTFTGLNEATILGIIASNGYILTYTETAIAWSSVVNVEDFVVSDVSGAGGGNVQEARGRIVTAVTTSLGIILFTDVNAVSVIYSGNADFPWNFKSIASSGGVADPHLVSDEQLSGFHQIYSTNGLQQIAHPGAKTVFPYVTDFVSGHTFEDYNPVTGQLEQTEITWDMRKSLAVVADRYLVVSYGVDPNAPMTHAVVLDVTQSRMGKIKLPHTVCFELRALDVSSVETPRGSLAFLQADGTIKTANFSMAATEVDSVVFMGKYQYVRQRWLELHEIEVENVREGAEFDITVLPTTDGKNSASFLSQEGYPLEVTKDYRRFGLDGAVGHNLTLKVEGKFNLISMILWFSIHGGR